MYLQTIGREHIDIIRYDTDKVQVRTIRVLLQIFFMILEMRFTGYDLLQTTIAVIFGVGIGIIIEHFGISEYASDGVRNRRSLSNVADIDSFFQQNINNESIGEYLKQLTWQPHVGGTPEHRKMK